MKNKLKQYKLAIVLLSFIIVIGVYALAEYYSYNSTVIENVKYDKLKTDFYLVSEGVIYQVYNEFHGFFIIVNDKPVRIDQSDNKPSLSKREFIPLY